MDESADDVFKWNVMGGYLAPNEINAQVPISNISAGIRYLQLIRVKTNSFGVAKLTSSIFNASPGDTIQFAFWISSKFPRFNNLQVKTRTNFDAQRLFVTAAVRSFILALHNY